MTQYPAKKTAKPLKPQWLLFITAFVDCRDYTKAAIAAGYSPASARVQVSRLLRNETVVSALNEACAKANDIAQLRNDITLNHVINELSTIAFYPFDKAVADGILGVKRKALVDIGRHLGLRIGTLDVVLKPPPKVDLKSLTRSELLQLEELCEAMEDRVAADNAVDITAQVREGEDESGDSEPEP